MYEQTKFGLCFAQTYLEIKFEENMAQPEYLNLHNKFKITTLNPQIR